MYYSLIEKYFLISAGGFIIAMDSRKNLDMNEVSRDLLGLSYVIAQGPNTAGEMVAAAKLAEECGFYSVFVPEHYYDREAPSILAPLLTLRKRSE